MPNQDRIIHKHNSLRHIVRVSIEGSSTSLSCDFLVTCIRLFYKCYSDWEVLTWPQNITTMGSEGLLINVELIRCNEIVSVGNHRVQGVHEVL